MLESEMLIKDPTPPVVVSERRGHERSFLGRRANLPSWVLTSVAIVSVLYFARGFFLPLTLGVLIALSLIPLVRFGEKHGVRAEFGALVILLVITGSVVFGMSALTDPLRGWLQRLPASTTAIESRVRGFFKPISGIQTTAEKIDVVATIQPTDAPPTVTIRAPTITERLLSAGRDMIISTALVLLFLYFFLAYGERLITTAREVFPISSDGSDARDVVNKIGRAMSQYLLLVGIINCVLGLVQYTAMSLLGMPNAPLWGVMATALNFIPYIGGLIGLGTISAVSIMTFDKLTQVLLAPAVYFTIDSLEGAVITPLIVGQRFSINPAVGLVWLVFWSWLWGPIGGFIAMPMLMVFKILCDHVPELAAVGAMMELERGPCRERISPLVVSEEVGR